MPRSVNLPPVKPDPPVVKLHNPDALSFVKLLVRGHDTGPIPKKYQLAAQRAVGRGLNRPSEVS